MHCAKARLFSCSGEHAARVVMVSICPTMYVLCYWSAYVQDGHYVPNISDLHDPRPRKRQSNYGSSHLIYLEKEPQGSSCMILIVPCCWAGNIYDLSFFLPLAFPLCLFCFKKELLQKFPKNNYLGKYLRSLEARIIKYLWIYFKGEESLNTETLAN